MTIWASWIAEDQRFLFLPSDSGGVEISEEDHAALLEGQAGGQVIAATEDGFPILVDPPVASPGLLAELERVWRDGQLSSTDGVVSRHRDELEDGLETTLTPEQYTELQGYRRALRNWPEDGSFPLSENRPVVPVWLAALPQ